MNVMQAWNQAALRLQGGNPTALVRDLTASTALLDGMPTNDIYLQMAMRSFQNCTKCTFMEVMGHDFFFQPLCVKPQLLICGGGHVAYHTARLGHSLDFAVTVMDDREEFANEARFPFARVLCAPFTESMGKVTGSKNHYFVITTRGHSWDSYCLEQALQLESAYVGMIGSHRKVAYVMTQMRRAGIPENKLEKVYSPIGLNIGAVTPAEIAISIAAQLVQVRSEKNSGVYVGDDVIDSIINGQARTIVTILNQMGSSPRGVGAVMAVCHDGSIRGTVGGGEAEQKAIDLAMQLKPGESRKFHYDMTAKTASQMGMVCGGHVDLLLEALEVSG